MILFQSPRTSKLVGLSARKTIWGLGEGHEVSSNEIPEHRAKSPWWVSRSLLQSRCYLRRYL